MRRPTALLCALLLPACGGEAFDEPWAEEEVFGELDQAELAVALMLSFVNGADATHERLDVDVGLDGRAATNIVSHRDGRDGRRATADDDPFDSLAELDAVPYVGATALAAIDRYARARHGDQSVTVEGISFTADEAQAALSLVNDPARREELLRVGLNGRVLSYIEARRPFADLPALAATPYVSAGVLGALRDWVSTRPGPTPGACAGTGGTYDGVAYSATEECQAVEFMNRARFSEMYLVPDASRRVIYTCGPGRVCGYRSSSWTRLAEFSTLAGVGRTALQKLKESIAEWRPNGLSYDTIGALRAGRAALVGRPVMLDKVWIGRTLPDYTDGAFTWFCAELRDSPTAAEYLVGCYQYIGADSSGGCNNENCFLGRARTWALLQGTLRRTSQPGTGGYRINLAPAFPGPPNPNIR